MKHLFPTITCLLTAHRKPTLGDALHSIITQTRTDAQVLVLDSGAWQRRQDKIDAAMLEAYVNYKDHPMIQWVFTGESVGAFQTTCMVAKVFNETLRSGLVRGKYLCTMYDDDLYHPQFFEKMAGYLDKHPDRKAVRCSEQWIVLNKDGTTKPVRVLEANRTMTQDDTFDQVVDGAQAMYHTESVLAIPQPIIPEETDTCRHSDGLFFEKLKHQIGQMDYLDEILVEHRFTPWSTFTKS